MSDEYRIAGSFYRFFTTFRMTGYSVMGKRNSATEIRSLSLSKGSKRNINEKDKAIAMQFVEKIHEFSLYIATHDPDGIEHQKLRN